MLEHFPLHRWQSLYHGLLSQLLVSLVLLLVFLLELPARIELSLVVHLLLVIQSLIIDHLLIVIVGRLRVVLLLLLRGRAHPIVMVVVLLHIAVLESTTIHGVHVVVVCQITRFMYVPVWLLVLHQHVFAFLFLDLARGLFNRDVARMRR